MEEGCLPASLLTGWVLLMPAVNAVVCKIWQAAAFPTSQLSIVTQENSVPFYPATFQL